MAKKGIKQVWPYARKVEKSRLRGTNKICRRVKRGSK